MLDLTVAKGIAPRLQDCKAPHQAGRRRKDCRRSKQG